MVGDSSQHEQVKGEHVSLMHIAGRAPLKRRGRGMKENNLVQQCITCASDMFGDFINLEND